MGNIVANYFGGSAYGKTGNAPVRPASFTGHSFVRHVKSINKHKGYGMISCDITQQLYGKDVFFSTSALQHDVNAGDQVRFQVRMEEKGPAADLVVKEGG